MSWAHISLPDSLLPVILGAAGASGVLSPRPRLIPVTADPIMSRSELRRCGLSKDLHRYQRQRSGDLVSPGVLGGPFKNSYGGIDSASPFVF